jgi:hypothetical protein
MTDQRTSSLSKRQLVVTRTTLPLLFSLILASGCSESTRTEQQKIVSDQPKAEFSLTELKSGEDYRSVRQKLIAQNWIPFQNQDPATCEIFQDRCRDWPETQSCAGSGTSPCRFLWRKGEDHIVVFTNHEIPQFVSYETYKPNSKIAASTESSGVNLSLNEQNLMKGVFMARCYATIVLVAQTDSSADANFKARAREWALRVNEFAIPKFISNDQFDQEVKNQLAIISSQKDTRSYLISSVKLCTENLGKI